MEAERTIPEAIQARLQGVHLMVVLAEADPDDLMFKGIASDPDEHSVFGAPTFGDLLHIVEDVRNSLCDGESEQLDGSS